MFIAICFLFILFGLYTKHGTVLGLLCKTYYLYSKILQKITKKRFHLPENKNKEEERSEHQNLDESFNETDQMRVVDSDKPVVALGTFFSSIEVPLNIVSCTSFWYSCNCWSDIFVKPNFFVHIDSASSAAGRTRFSTFKEERRFSTQAYSPWKYPLPWYSRLVATIGSSATS
jgi:hypothetical protein